MTSREVALPKGKPMTVGKFLVHAGIASGRMMASTFTVGPFVQVNGGRAYDVKVGDEVRVHPVRNPVDWTSEDVVTFHAV